MLTVSEFMEGKDHSFNSLCTLPGVQCQAFNEWCLTTYLPVHSAGRVMSSCKLYCVILHNGHRFLFYISCYMISYSVLCMSVPGIMLSNSTDMFTETCFQLAAYDPRVGSHSLSPVLSQPALNTCHMPRAGRRP